MELSDLSKLKELIEARYVARVTWFAAAKRRLGSNEEREALLLATAAEKAADAEYRAIIIRHEMKEKTDAGKG